MIHVYWAGRVQRDMAAYLKYIRSEIPWVAVAIETWPDDDPYGAGFLNKIRIDAHLDPLRTWAEQHLGRPALVFTNRQIRQTSTSIAPATGATRWPIALVTTTY